MTFKEHNCEALPKTGCSIYIEEDDPAWTLSIYKEATESDLEENHHLENIGDIIWGTRIEILYCPFCGEKLTELESVEPDGYGQSKHNDFSRWK